MDVVEVVEEEEEEVEEEKIFERCLSREERVERAERWPSRVW